ncbi:MAG: hypothetical protein ABIO91_00865 [Pyrinomonadaceae bacterium]
MERQTLTIGVFLVFIFATATSWRLRPEDDPQSWNDFQHTLPLHKYVDFTTTVTMRFLVRTTWKIKG